MWLLLLLAGCVKPVPEGVERARRLPRPPAPAAAELPDPRSPLDAPAPLLAGSDASLDLESLVRTTTRYNLAGDFSGLTVDRREADSVLRHLAADPRWRVGWWDGALLAFARRPEGERFTVPRDGVHRQEGTWWRTDLRFEPWDPTSAWATSSRVTRVTPDRSAVGTAAFHLPGDLRATAITIEGPVLALDVFEATTRPGRPRTGEQLTEVPALLDAIVAGVALLPPGEPARSMPELFLRSPGPGLLEAWGRVNPGAEGTTWLRLLDAELVPWEEAAVGAGSAEIVGWSADPRHQFYLQGTFPVPAGPRFSGTAELWFQPESGGERTRLAAFIVDVPAR